MIVLDSVLGPAELKQIRDIVAEAEFQDGAATAGSRASAVKNNLQMKKTDDQAVILKNLINDRLMRNPEFCRFALPKRIAPPLLSCYNVGMAYGRHVDDAIMRPNGKELRSDLSVTVFLNDPGDYDGGELIVETHENEEAIKLPRGCAVVYQSTSLHRVAPVTRGQRLAAVTWVQSLVRDPGQRDLLADIAAARDCLAAQSGESFATPTDRAFRAYSNLLRRWAEF